MESIDRSEFIEGVRVFEVHEKRDAMYKVATFLLKEFWGNPSKMAEGLGVLLLTWNQSFYSYGSTFDFDKLEEIIKNHSEKIALFRKRDISTLSDSDKKDITKLFDDLLEALKLSKGNRKGRKSPVSVAKALHLLAPNFFPIWDEKIAKHYDCYYKENPAEKYITFCEKTKAIANAVGSYINRSDKTLLKLIDQYNYSKYTKKWI